MKKKILLIALIGMCFGIQAQGHHFEITKQSSYFPNGVADQVAYIDLGDIQIWGWIEVTLTGSFSYQNTIGKYTKRYEIGNNTGSGPPRQSSEVPVAFGPVVDQWKLGNIEKNNQNHLVIPIYHLVSTGNSIVVNIKGMSATSFDETLFTIIAPTTLVNSETKDVAFFKKDITTDGKIGIGTKDPKAILDVGKFINNEVLGTVFGRLAEGNTTGDGTYLGVKGYSTQSTIYGGKSFSIEHNFYGNTNSSINFFRGSGVTGGYLTFNTYNNTERMRVAHTGNVGIGTTNPTKKLEVKGNDGVGIRLFNQTANTWDILNSQYGKLDFVRGGSNIFMRIDQNGNVGIGTPNPSKKLEVRGSDGVGIRLFNEVANTWDILNSQYGRLDFVRGSTNVFMRIDQSGNVGIGTTNINGWKMAVNGKIRAKEIKVETSWSDFVFESDYKLPTLSEVEQYIKEKGHLKNIPSAKEVEKNGIFLGEMDSKLLQKIEELTLYTIQQEKKIKELESLNTKLLELQKRLEKLESK